MTEGGRKRAVSFVMSVVAILLTEALVSSRFDPYFEPTAFAYLSSIGKHQADRAFVAVVDITDLTSKISAEDSIPASGINSLLDQLTGDSFEKEIGPVIVGVDVDLAAQRSNSVNATFSDPKKASGKGDATILVPFTGTYESHRAIVAKAYEITPTPSSRSKVVLGVGPAVTDPRRAFSEFEVGSQEIKPENLAHLAGSILTVPDPRAMLLGLRERRPMSEPLLTLGEKIVRYCDQRLPDEVPVSEYWSVAFEHQLSEQYGFPRNFIVRPDWRYVGYGWLKKEEARTFHARTSLRSIPASENPAPGQTTAFDCRLGKAEADRLYASVREFRKTSGATDSCPVILLVGDAKPGDQTDQFGLQAFPLGKQPSNFVPGDVELFPGVYQHACYIDTALNSPVHRLGGVWSTLLSIFLGIITAATVATKQERPRKDRWVLFYRTTGILSGIFIFIALWELGIPRLVTVLVSALLELSILVHAIEPGKRGGRVKAHLFDEAIGRNLRLGVAALIFLIAITLARLGYFYTGFLASLLFLLLDPYFGAVLDLPEFGLNKALARCFPPKPEKPKGKILSTVK